ncbi:MAG: RNA-binding protein [Sphingobacteriales bacterium]|nr:MAG: RNA-binding protein [Sphingobacteriales bacterium]
MNIVISNIDASATNSALESLFASHGSVASAEIVLDVFTGAPRGFAYVQMPDETQARQAIQALNGTEWQGHVLAVEEAAEKKELKGSYKVGNGAVWAPRTRRR